MRLHYLIRPTAEELGKVAAVNWAFVKSDGRQLRDRWLLRLARALPPRLLLWCYIVVVAHASSGRHGHRHVGDLGWEEICRLWEEDHALR